SGPRPPVRTRARGVLSAGSPALRGVRRGRAPGDVPPRPHCVRHAGRAPGRMVRRPLPARSGTRADRAHRQRGDVLHRAHALAGLTLGLCCGFSGRRSLGRSMLAGAAVGIGAASRYFLVTLLPVLLAADVATARAGRGRPRDLVAGLVAVPLAFVAAAPYLLLD